MENLFEPVYRHYTAREIKPAGWMKKQLRIQAEGLSGHLDLMWPDVARSSWIGGDREGWERVPYWLDGFVPLAYLLEDEDLIARAKRYIEAILSSQREDGWICPCTDEARAGYDVWAVFLICKALMVYGECSGDTRAETAVYRALQNLHGHLRKHTLFNWGQSRWFECLIPLKWLWDKQPEEWMLRLAVTLRTQGLDWETLFSVWRDSEPRREWTQQTHIVNLAMALKAGAVFSGLSGEDPDAFARKMYAMLHAAHGSAIGHIIGDECLAGQSPVHGTELCSVAEMMYSCEVLSEITGDRFWMDLNETLAFNSLPATISEDMWTHQYLQLENQIACAVQQNPPVYGTNSAESNLFGLEPNYGCCTANLHQAWPKLALSAFLCREKEILSAILIPCELRTRIGRTPVTVALDTAYPFGNRLTYTVECAEAAEFTLSIRIPGFVKAAAVDGQPAAPGSVVSLRRRWQGKTVFEAEFRFEPEWISRPGNMVCLRRGPLFYALPIRAGSVMHEYTRDGVERRFPYCDYEYFPESEWAYAFAGKEVRVIENGIGGRPFSREHPPVQIEADMSRIDWGLYPGQTLVCAEEPRSREPLTMEKKLLQPYGCTTLRMTVMPRAESGEKR